MDEQITEADEQLTDIAQNEYGDDVLEENDTQIIAAGKFYSGPIPDPHTLQQYEKILPGAADRILAMAEKEQKNRHENNSKLIKELTLNSRYGIIIAGILSLLCIVAGVVCALADKTLFGLFIGGGGISVIAATFLKYTGLISGIQTEKENIEE